MVFLAVKCKVLCQFFKELFFNCKLFKIFDKLTSLLRVTEFESVVSLFYVKGAIEIIIIIIYHTSIKFCVGIQFTISIWTSAYTP